MCGRYLLTSSVETIGASFEVDARLNLGARYNIAPGQLIPIVRMNEKEGGRELAAVEWGLVPGWMKDRPVGRLMINARSETIAEKPSFRTAFKRRRCLVPSNGFYEWQAQADGKHPHYIYLAEGALFAFAGIWESWIDPKTEQAIETAALITRQAYSNIQHIHERMPVMLASSDYEPWLEGEDPGQNIFDRMALVPEGEILFHEISRQVNSIGNGDRSIIEPVRG